MVIVIGMKKSMVRSDATAGHDDDDDDDSYSDDDDTIIVVVLRDVIALQVMGWQC